MQVKRGVIAAMVGLLVTLTASWACAQQGHIQLKSVAEVEKEVVSQDGKRELQRMPAATVVPGDEIIFTTMYENIGPKRAENAVITNPIPEHMLYQEGSAEGEGTRVAFSVDGGKAYDLPGNLFVFDASGRKFPARTQDYTHIRWTFENPLPSGTKGKVRFRAVLK